MEHHEPDKPKRRVFTEAANRLLSALLTITMVTQAIPTSAYAEMMSEANNPAPQEQTVQEAQEETAASTDEANAASTEATQADDQGGSEETEAPDDANAPPAEGTQTEGTKEDSSAADAADEQTAEQATILVQVENAIVSINGADIAESSDSVSIPAATGIDFSVRAAEGYELNDQSVKLTVDGIETQLDASGSYTLSAEGAKNGTVITARATKIPVETVYTYEDDNIVVTATLDQATAIPDDAELKVTPITQAASEQGSYNYGAYMEALNVAAGAETDKPVYTVDNTLLFDVAFIQTNAETGEQTELQPKEGAVTVKFQFKKGQLAEQLGVKEAADIEANHLPIVETAKAATTAASTGIATADVIVEKLEGDNLRVESVDTVEVKASSFSAYAFSFVQEEAEEAEEAVEEAKDEKDAKDKKDAKDSKDKKDAKDEKDAKKSDTMTAQAVGDLYDIQLEVNPAGLSLHDSDRFWVFLSGQGTDGQPVYYLSRLRIGNTQGTVKIPVQYNENGTFKADWQDNNGNQRNRPGQQNIVTLANPDNVQAYLIRADSDNVLTMNQATQQSNCDYIGEGGPVKNYSIESIKSSTSAAKFVLSQAQIDPAVRTPEEILGDAHEFGITAITYKQVGHTETNFAVHNLHDEQNIDVDGSGDACVPFYAAHIDEGTWLQVTNGTRTDVDIFVPADEAKKVDETHFTEMRQRGQDINVITDMSEGEIKNYVSSLIVNGQNVANQLSSFTTISPTTHLNHYTLDTTSFGDGTIYVNAEGILPAISQNGGLTIVKNPNQSIVFNFNGAYPDDKNPLKIAKYTVVCDGKEIDTTTQAMDGGGSSPSQKNQDVDNYIFEHIFWNAPNAGRVILEDAAGLFLFPSSQYVTQTNGAGWILSGGTVESTGSSEWHFYRHKRHYKAKGDFTLQALKKLVNSKGEPISFDNKGFTFDLYQTDANGNRTSGILETQSANGATGQVEFTQFHYTEATVPEGETRTFYYELVERMPEGGVQNKDGTYTWQGIVYNARPIFVEVIATNTPDSAGAATGKITFQIKYKCEGASQFIDASETSTTVYSIGTFTNTKEDASADLWVHKNNDYKWGSSDKFEFTLTALNGAPMPTGTSGTTKTVSVINGLANHFGEMKYSSPGTYKYTVQEVVPDDAVAVNAIGGAYPTYQQATSSGMSQANIESTKWRDNNGILYDASLHTVTVTVSESPMTVSIADDHDTAVTTDNSVLTFVNDREEKGSLKLRKLVTVNGKSIKDKEDSDKEFAEKYIYFTDGTYEFEVSGTGSVSSWGTHTVSITMKDGAAESAVLDKGKSGETALSIDGEGYAEIPGLTPGTYNYTEIVSSNPANTKPVGASSGTFTVVAGKTSFSVPDEAKASVTNNFETGSLKISKRINVNGSPRVSPTIVGMEGLFELIKGDYEFRPAPSR